MTFLPLASALLASRQSGHPAICPTEQDTPSTEEAAYDVQQQVTTALIKKDGPIIAWKVGSATPTAEPFAAPIHAATVFTAMPGPSPSFFRYIGVEAELAYRFDRTPIVTSDGCTNEAITEALGAIHAVIEIVDTRFSKPGIADPLVQRADQQGHGALIIGPGRRDWQAVSPLQERVKLMINGRTAADHEGGNSAGDPMRLLVWLAVHAAQRGMPLTAGTIVTTGSTTGTIWVAANTRVEAEFASIGRLTLDLS